MDRYKKVRGMHDIMPGETEKWQFAETVLADSAKLHGYREIRPPVIEERMLFERSIGASSDIISKEIYSFQDRKGRHLALRPEGTASVVRAFIESAPPIPGKITRLYYYGPMFRYDRPQKGRYRQFYQFGVELLGGKHPFFDGEAVALLDFMARKLNITGYYFAINTLGCPKCKSAYTEIVRSALSAKEDSLCEDCRTRLKISPLRIFDCKNAECRESAACAPAVTETLCKECLDHFGEFEEYVKKAGIPCKKQSGLVRGLDYYTRTVFELYVNGDENAVAAGGRYDSLVRELGGADTPAVGFALGMERLISIVNFKLEKTPSVYLAAMGKAAALKGISIVKELRNEGIAAETDYEDRGLKAHLKNADRSGAQWCLIVGDRELEKNEFILKNMVTGEQENISEDTYLKRIKELIK
ncbi:MAG: histidine--tRNA ligase [Candidatus Omnitrophica bacterium]|nr:histidine--tRNA ligase [Candidatus Omnitrophota bacterium]